MIERIDIFMPPVSQHGMIPYVTGEIYKALQRENIKSHLLIAERENPDPFLKSIFSDPPQYTLSVNGLLPDTQGHFFCDMIKIPHIALLFSSPNGFVSLTQSALNIISCPDAYAFNFFKGIGAKHVLYTPPGVSRDLAPDPTLEKKYDIVLFGSCFDVEKIYAKWKKKYSKEIVELLDRSQQIALSDDTTPYFEAFVQALNETSGINPGTLNVFELFGELEEFIKIRDRVELIKAIQGVDIHVFGDEVSSFKNVIHHPAVPYEETFDIMRQAKIVLSSSGWIKSGAHLSLFSSMACGAVGVTAENHFLKETLKSEEDLLFYHFGKWEGINEKIQAVLQNDEKREALVKNGIEKVMENHTWDHRIHHLIKTLPHVAK